MKKLLFIFALTFSHFFNVNAQKEKLDALFEKYQETEGVTSIKIAKPMFSMLSKLNINDGELDAVKPFLNKINGLKIMIIEENPEDSGSDKPASFYKNLSKEILTSVNKLNYTELMTVNSKDNKIKFLSSNANNGNLDDLLLNINSEGNTVLMMLDGKISMDDINKLIEESESQSPKVKNTEVTTTTTSETTITSGEERKVGKFTGIAVSNGIKVNFTQGKNQSVVVETDENMQQYVSTVVENGILKVSIKSNGKKNLNFKKLLVQVEAPRLSTVDVSSGALLTTINKVQEDNFTAEVSSGANLNADLDVKNNAKLEIGSGANMKVALKANNFEFTGNSGSMATITGRVQNAKFDLSSAAACNAQNLESVNATAAASSGSNLKLSASGKLAAVASSGASVRYNGNPKDTSNSHESSGGSVKPLN